MENFMDNFFSKKENEETIYSQKKNVWNNNFLNLKTDEFEFDNIIFED